MRMIPDRGEVAEHYPVLVDVDGRTVSCSMDERNGISPGMQCVVLELGPNRSPRLSVGTVSALDTASLDLREELAKRAGAGAIVSLVDGALVDELLQELA